METLVYMIIGGCVGGVLGWLLARDQIRQRLDELRETTEERAEKRARERAKEEADALVKNAEIEARSLVAEARREADDEFKQRRQGLDNVEQRLGRRESNLDDRAQRLDERESKIQEREETLDGRHKELEERDASLREKRRKVERTLEEITDYSAEEARQKLEEQLMTRAERQAQARIREIERKAEQEAQARARKIIGVACQRFAGDFVADKCVNVVDLPSDDMKGRIIGREGRNIRALEKVTGADVIVDDTPEVVVISCFDPVRREVARRSLEKLVADGRIHPTRIEEVVEKSRKEVDQYVREAGREATLELGIHGLHDELEELVGRLKFRTSYGQNMWAHSIEVGYLCGLMAAELDDDVMAARRAGLLHDIGKALSHERRESHALVGAEYADRFGESELVRNAIAAHHNEEPQESVIAHLVIAADALSGARPGARREVLGAYVKRLKDLEKISSQFDGVKKSYAIQAGREIRVMVAHDAVDDEGARKLSQEIARRIEDELVYPGQVMVTVIREMRATEYAR